jgi:hypothetical protein
MNQSKKMLKLNYTLKKILFFGLILIVFSSCKTTSAIGTGNVKKRNTNFLLQKMEENRVSYDWFAAKAKVKFESKDQNISFTTNLRMRHDSLIWIKVQKISIEGLRVKMTPDKIEVLNRQDNKYIVEDFSSIKKQIPIPFGFKDMEDLFAGNPIMKEGINFEASVDSGCYLLSGNIYNENDKSQKKGEVKIWLNSDYRIVRVFAKIDENQINANFADFQPVNEKQLIAFEKDIQIQSPESGEIRLKINFNKVDLNEEQDVKFEVPDHYEKVTNGKKLKN